MQLQVFQSLLHRGLRCGAWFVCACDVRYVSVMSHWKVVADVGEILSGLVEMLEGIDWYTLWMKHLSFMVLQNKLVLVAPVSGEHQWATISTFMQRCFTPFLWLISKVASMIWTLGPHKILDGNPWTVTVPLKFRIQLYVKMPMYDIIWHHNYFGWHTYSYEISTGPSRPHRIFPMEIPHRPNAISFNTMMAGSPTDLEGNNCMSKL